MAKLLVLSLLMPLLLHGVVRGEDSLAEVGLVLCRLAERVLFRPRESSSQNDMICGSTRVFCQAREGAKKDGFWPPSPFRSSDRTSVEERRYL